uniref:Uncharacterized protein n=1 Tax=Trypanosoma congolense (strain IL3000) TaxID=1068625 RepID=G0UWD6_TRYCI|nr:conserved hypothetical protein [Trypanosoma congolense IL3000]
MAYSRRATHAGSWYEASSAALKSAIEGYFAVASKSSVNENESLIGVISPHAGISYSGMTAAHAYVKMRDYIYGPKGSCVTRIFVLGPSHVKWFDGVEVCEARQYETPFGPVCVNSAVAGGVGQALRSAGVPVGTMDRSTDEEEHSIEMQLPFLAYVLNYPPNGCPPAKDRIELVPLLIGDTTRAMEEAIGVVLAEHFRDKQNLFVMSSDFCHWGSRFRYTYHYEREKYPEIGDAIIAMDHEGMRLLEGRDVEGWYRYLSATKNTICGRRPISVAVAALCANKKAKVSFVHYSQSNRCRNLTDSSVSYAAAVITEDV